MEKIGRFFTPDALGKSRPVDQQPDEDDDRDRVAYDAWLPIWHPGTTKALERDRFLLLEPMVGVEPTTCCLRNYPSVRTGPIVVSVDLIGMP